MIDYHTRKLLELIPHGRVNAISTYELADAYGVKLTGLKSAINDLILSGALIVHCSDGYYIPTIDDHIEAWGYLDTLRDDNLHRAYKKAFFKYLMKNEKGGLSC